MTTIDRFPSFVSSRDFSAEEDRFASDDDTESYERSIAGESDPSDETATCWSWSDGDDLTEESAVSTWAAEDDDSVVMSVGFHSSPSYAELENLLDRAEEYVEWKDERLVEHEQRIAMLEDLLHRALLSVARQDSSGPLKDDDELQSAVEDTHDTEVDFRNRSSQLVTAVDVCEKLLLVLHARVIESLFLPLRVLARHYYPTYLSLVSLAYNPRTATAELPGHVSHHVVDAFRSTDITLAFLASKCLAIVNQSQRQGWRDNHVKSGAEVSYDDMVSFVEQIGTELGWRRAEVERVVWHCGEGFSRSA